MAFEFLTQLVYPSLPVPGGDRIVALRMWDAAASRPERRALHEFMLWRDELRSVDDIGIFRVIERNLRWQDVARCAGPGGGDQRGGLPCRGRPRTAWPHAGRGRRRARRGARRRAGARRLARRVRVRPRHSWDARFAWAESRHAVVGVMPEGFAFPISESFWVPFQLTSSSYLPLEGPPDSHLRPSRAGTRT